MKSHYLRYKVKGMEIKSICVFCGSNLGSSFLFSEQAIYLASLLKERNIRLIYGGGERGLMGLLAKSLYKAGGEVIAVTPKVFEEENSSMKYISENKIVDTMHDRKALMYELSDAFIAMPGGIGTLEELSEVFAWQSIGIFNKPLALFNIDGYFDPLIMFLDNMVDEEFLSQDARVKLIVQENAKTILNEIEKNNSPF